jgi:plasmid stability protein
MTTLTIRNLPSEVHKALKRRAVENDNSTEEEVRRILAAAVAPSENLADILLAIGKQLEGAEVDFGRDKRPFQPEALS